MGWSLWFMSEGADVKKEGGEGRRGEEKRRKKKKE
jgi:hypothetical protein